MIEQFERSRKWQLVVLGLLALITRLPFQSRVLYNWDSVNFALGVLSFDVIKHRPHPPGYILYVASARLLTLLTDDPNTSLVWLSIAAGVLLAWQSYALGQRLFGARDALIGTLLLVTSPLVWFYNEVALTYALEGFFSIAIAYTCYQTLTGATRWAYVSALLLGLAGGIRQTTLLIMLPLALFAATRLPWRHRLGAGAVLIAVCLGWGLPLLSQTGGVVAYISASRQLSANVGPGRFIDMFNSLFYAGHVAFLLVLGHWLGLFPIENGTQPGWRRWFLILWIVPGLLVVAFGHIGQAGYVFFVLPALFIYTPGLLRGALRRLEAIWPAAQGRPQATLEQKIALSTLALAVIGATVFFFGGNAYIRRQDQRWILAQRLLDRYLPSETIILTDTRRDGSFRHASYYLPDYHVYAFAATALSDPLPVVDPPRAAGWLFHSYRGEDNYDLDPAHHQLNVQLDLPPGMSGLLITDESLLATLTTADGGDALRRHATRVDGGLIYVALPAGAHQVAVVDGQLVVY